MCVRVYVCLYICHCFRFLLASRLCIGPAFSSPSATMPPQRQNFLNLSPFTQSLMWQLACWSHCLYVLHSSSPVTASFHTGAHLERWMIVSSLGLPLRREAAPQVRRWLDNFGIALFCKIIGIMEYLVLSCLAMRS